MHTIMVIGAGLALLGVSLLFGRLMGGPAPGAIADAAKYFIPIWLLGALINMWLGVSRAGYSLAEEAPIFVVIFLVPAAVAALIWWKF